MNIGINMTNLTARTTALRGAGENFTHQALNTIDERSTISAVRNSVVAHNQTNQIHLTVGEYLVQAANVVQDIGVGFFEIDQAASSVMQR